MKLGTKPRGASALFWFLLFTAYSVAAVGVVVLDAGNDDYGALSKVSATTVQAPEEMRNLGAAQMAALYRARSGTPFTSLPPGSTVRIVWPDGSSEYVVVANPASSGGVRPIPGTQREAAEDAVEAVVGPEADAPDSARPPQSRPALRTDAEAVRLE